VVDNPLSSLCTADCAPPSELRSQDTWSCRICVQSKFPEADARSGRRKEGSTMVYAGLLGIRIASDLEEKRFDEAVMVIEDSADAVANEKRSWGGVNKIVVILKIW